MQARPLKTRPPIKVEIKSILKGLSDVFGYKAGYDMPLCDDPVQTAYDYNPLFQLIGFDTCPVNIQSRRKLFSHTKPKTGQHPKAFLQWGVEVMHAGHVVFEIADHQTLVRIDFRENWPHDDEQTYQIDDMHVFDGSTEYQIDCESFDQKHLMSAVLQCVEGTVSQMKAGYNSAADVQFEGMARVIQSINDFSDQCNLICAGLAAGVQHQTP